MTKAPTLLVGAGGGIGRTLAERLDAAGRSVLLAGRTPASLTEVAAGLAGEASCFTVDVTDADQVRRLADQVPDLGHVVLAVGDLLIAPLVSLDLSQARAAFDSKFWAGMHVGKYLGPRIEDGGSLTFLGGAGTPPDWHAPQDWSVTAAGNAALAALTQVLAKELAPVRVNIVSPGLVLDGTDRHAEPGVSLLPAGHGGLARDIAEAIEMLQGNPFITGVSLPVDGGARLM
ncbi:SDR family oxidoreductase [Streptomyces sp. NPDC017435]|uniref:SDR family oxidoreductase n=1 Tax=Streptomyces sp. NPDC017435 TaxID=3364995 RepID=UPI003789D97F